jgi:hypothetical protein
MITDVKALISVEQITWGGFCDNEFENSLVLLNIPRILYFNEVS